MSERITPGDGGEQHAVVNEYKVLPEPGDRTEARTWYADTFAGDAVKALAHALGVFQHDLARMSVLKVWDVSVSVNLADDVLRQKLAQLSQNLKVS
jgi:hypothetical protein